MRLPYFTNETCSRRSFHSAVTSCLSRRIVHSDSSQKHSGDQLTFARMYLVVKPSEEKLPQIEETDIDIAAERFRELEGQVYNRSSTPSNEPFDQFIRKGLICLVMLRHLLQDFRFPTPNRVEIRVRPKCRYNAPTSSPAFARVPLQSRARHLSRGSARIAYGSADRERRGPFHGKM